eukprot:scaffold38243_cov75-Cyclotella_meneghiniana.AAC.9
MAQQAVSYFDKSFALTSRLSVSLAFSKKDGPPPTTEYRPWSKHSAGSSRNQKLQEKLQQKVGDVESNIKSNDEDQSDNEESEEIRKKREEFLSAMGVTAGSKDAVSKSKFWANDDAMPAESENANISPVEEAKEEDPQNSSDDSSSSESENERNVERKETGKENTVSSDLDFLRSKQVNANVLNDDDDGSQDSDQSSSDSEDSSSSDDDAANEEQISEHKQSQSKDHDNAAMPLEGDLKVSSTQPLATLEDRLFVRNLPFTTTEEELHETFSQFGTVLTVHIPVDDSKRNKGYAFVTFQSKHDAKTAMETMDGEDFQGRLIHILPARPSSDQTGDDGTNANMTYKEKQALARQKEAEASMKSWSASFMRGDAVVDNLSDRLGVSKGDVLNVKDGISSGNAAVRLALGETHIISENIAFFESHGVDISTLERSGADKQNNAQLPKRSTHMIIVKNLPYDTTVEDLTRTFHAIGGDTPKRILLPPSKTAALVDYSHATDARRAFRRLSYKKFKHVPLYLEWAPMMTESQSKMQDGKDATNEAQETTVQRNDFTEADDIGDAGNTQSIYVKNLNFATTEDALSTAFKKAGFCPRAVKIPTKAAPTKKQQTAAENHETRLSMGFGFVEFASQEEAKKAMKSLQGILVDGHSLEVKLSSKNLSEPSPAIKSSKSTKIMIRNVPFEATRSELLKLFGLFGQLKKVRLPKKFDGTHRGFAFCEFLTSKEAQNAMNTLSRTHLYGRHLVLEWADDENKDGKVDVDKVREKAKRDATRAGLGDVGKEKVKKMQHVKFD